MYLDKYHSELFISFTRARAWVSLGISNPQNELYIR